MDSSPGHVVTSALPPLDIPSVSLADLVLAQVERLGERAALIEAATGRALSYREFGAQVAAFGANLLSRGARKGEVLGIQLPNMPEYAVVFHGTVRAGGVVTTINPAYTAREVNGQLLDSGATRLAVAAAGLEQAILAAIGTRIVEIIVIGGDAVAIAAAVAAVRHAGAPVPAIAALEVLLRPPATRPEWPAVAPEDVVAMPYSSGTTGVSKGVMLTHRNLVANVVQVNAAVPVGGGDVLMAVLPFFHIYGLTVIMNAGLASGATLVTMPRFDLEGFLRAHQDHRITHTYVAPPIVVALAKHPMVDDFDLGALRFMLSGAAPLSAEVAAEAGQRIGVEIVQGYGMTELSPVTHFTPAGRNRPGSAGITVSNTECRIVDPSSGATLGPSLDGELQIRGPQVMKGYLNNPAATAATLDADGWLHTGDIAHFDADGYLYIVDRLKELIKYKGFQVPPAELEALLLTHPDVADAAVVGLPDDEAGELPVGFVVPRGGRNVDAAALMSFVATQVAHYKQLRRITFIDAIPKSASGKILRRQLRAS